jgi:hypothetical protein
MTVLTPVITPSREALPVKPVSRSIGRVDATFDDETLVASTARPGDSSRTPPGLAARCSLTT